MARIGILALLIASLLGACSSPTASATMSPSVGVSPSPSAIVSALPPDTTFPSEVACSTKVTLRPLDDVAFNADFPASKACTFGPAPSPSPGS